ncbi:unnamed protein product [Cylicocyclus nassatus]|uniref:MSP domain-containing protein n=1 Tax=Cylicocyclus nassatus TaxID=53992 RepID=A0AA36H804_CYLNA|nr:unnamed protein product [Cylicocyclus nassatus]
MCALGWPTDLVFTQYAALVVSYTLSISMGLAILCGRKKGDTHATKKSSAAESESSTSSSSIIVKPPEKKHKKASKEGKSKEGKAQTPSSKRRTGESVRKGVRAPGKAPVPAPAPAPAPVPVPLPLPQTLSQFQRAESLKSLPPMKSIAPMPLQSAARTLQLQSAISDDVSKARPLSLSQMSTLKETAPGSDGAYEDVNIVVEPELAPGGEKLVEAKAPPEPGMEDEGLKTVKPEATRDVPPTGDASKTTLTVDPPVSTFPTTGGRLYHTLKNPRGTRMVFKIKCSNNNDYGINPVYGFVEANGTVPINITRLPGPPKEDRMVIQFVETTEALSVGAEAAFKLASPWAYVSTTVPLRVVAGLPPMAPTAGAKPPPPAPAAAPKPPPPPPPPASKPASRIPPVPVPLSPRPVVPVAAAPTKLPPPPPKPALPPPIPTPKPTAISAPKVAAASPKPVPVATKVPIATPPPPPKALSPTPAKPIIPARPSLVPPLAAPKPGAPLALPGTGLSYFAAPGQTPVIPGLPSPTAPPPAGVPPAFAGAKGLPVASVYVTQQRK